MVSACWDGTTSVGTMFGAFTNSLSSAMVLFVVVLIAGTVSVSALNCYFLLLESDWCGVERTLAGDIC